MTQIGMSQLKKIEPIVFIFTHTLNSHVNDNNDLNNLVILFR